MMGDPVGDTVGTAEAFTVGAGDGRTEGALVDGAVVVGASVEGANEGANVCGFKKIGGVGEFVKEDSGGYETGAFVGLATGRLFMAPIFVVG
jgi:hypothetical protein